MENIMVPILPLLNDNSVSYHYADISQLRETSLGVPVTLDHVIIGGITDYEVVSVDDHFHLAAVVGISEVPLDLVSDILYSEECHREIVARFQTLQQKCDGNPSIVKLDTVAELRFTMIPKPFVSESVH